MFARLVAVVVAAAPAATLSPPSEARDGAWSRTLSFSDKAGEHVVKFELTAPKVRKSGEDFEQRSRSLNVIHTAKGFSPTAPPAQEGFSPTALPGQQGKEVWRAKDFVEKCDFDLTLEFVDGSIEVTDLDDDGEGEISFLYQSACRSDVSPLTAKLLMYEGTTKYALRGNSRVQVGEKEFAGGQFTKDPAFDKAPAQFLSFAEAKWKRLVAAPGENQP